MAVRRVAENNGLASGDVFVSNAVESAIGTRHRIVGHPMTSR